MARCKHQTGVFYEVIEATHSRIIEDGVLDRESYNNDYGDLIYHKFRCSNCNRLWKWKIKPVDKWLQELFLAAYPNDFTN